MSGRVCCCSYETCGVLIGSIGIIYAFTCIPLLVVILIAYEDHFKELNSYLYWVLIVFICIHVISMVASILLIVASIKHFYGIIVTWLVIEAFVIIIPIAMIIAIFVMYSTDFYKYGTVVLIFLVLLVTVVIKMLFWFLIVKVHHIIKHKIYLSELGSNRKGSNFDNPDDRQQNYDPRKFDSRREDMSYEQSMRRERPINDRRNFETPEDNNRTYNPKQARCCCSEQQNNGAKIIICCPKDRSYEQPMRRERPIDGRRQQMAYNSNSDVQHNAPPIVRTKNGSVILEWKIGSKGKPPNKRYN